MRSFLTNLRVGLVGFALLGACGSSGSSNLLSPEDGVKACATIVACPFFGVFADMQECVGNVENLSTPGAFHLPIVALWDVDQWRCFARAGTDCDAAERCMNNGQIETCKSESCDGTAVKTCYHGTVSRVSCTALSPEQTCGTKPATGAISCVATGASCTQSVCAGDKIEVCGDNKQSFTAVDCGQYGATCVTGSTSSSLQCRGTGASCAAGSNGRCDGNRVVPCLDGQEGSAVDCSAIGQLCVSGTTNNKSWAVCALGSECSDSATTTCTGSTVSVCYLGKTLSYDCAAHGYSGCSASGCTP